MNIGLDNIVVAQTILSEVDGEKGRLIIRGFSVETLAETFTFEEVTARLWEGFTQDTTESLTLELGKARLRAFEILPSFLDIANKLTFIEGLRLGLASLSDKEEVPHHYLLTGAIAVFLAGLIRSKKGLPLIKPDPSLRQAEDFLRMLHGKRVDKSLEQALDKYLITISDHGMNASTFTARSIASTKAGLISAVIGGISALKGPLHGGAPGPVLDMLDEIKGDKNIENWVKTELAQGKRLMGFGHRIYKVRDPRADVLKQVVSSLRSSGNERLIFAEKVETAILRELVKHKPDRPLHTNVEFYTALLLEAIGLERDVFTPVFAMGRVVGWIAHVFEQEKTGRLIRPQSEYIGKKVCDRQTAFQ
ncbi:MAG: citrate synthase/methylcitrate synthase [Acidobacteria bacterium]|nr:citrate synthase/methylcitrate synthase [Acidobacteriota bacterium]